jgi:peptidylprolyl isomerase
MTRTIAALMLICSAPAVAGEVVARVGGREVGGDEVRAYVESLGPEQRAALAKDPSLLTQTVRTYLARKAVLQAALAKKWDDDPAVKAKLARVRDEALAELYLESVSQPAKDYPSEAELRAAYAASPAAFDVPKQYRLAQIFVPAGEGAESKASALQRRLEAGEPFASVAQKENGGQHGGEIGWLTEAQIVPRVREVAIKLEKGKSSKPLKLDDGFHLVQLLDVKLASKLKFEEVKDVLAQRMRAEQAKKNRQLYLEHLLEQDPPAVNELALFGLLGGGK